MTQSKEKGPLRKIRGELGCRIKKRITTLSITEKKETGKIKSEKRYTSTAMGN